MREMEKNFVAYKNNHETPTVKCLLLKKKVVNNSNCDFHALYNKTNLTTKIGISYIHIPYL